MGENKKHPSLKTFVLIFVALLLLMRVVTVDGEPVSLWEGIQFSFYGAVIFSIPVWLVQAVYFYALKKGGKIPGVNAIKSLRKEATARLRMARDKRETKQEEQTPSGQHDIEEHKTPLQNIDAEAAEEEKRREAQAAQEAECRRKQEEKERKAAEEEKRKREQEAKARAERLRLIEETRQEEERLRAEKEQREAEEAKKKAARMELLKSYDEDQLLCLALEYAAARLHINKESLGEYLLVVSPEMVQTLLLCLEKLGAISKTLQPGNYLCQVDKKKAIQIAKENNNLQGYVQSVLNPREISVQDMDEMDGKEFEYFCGDLLSKSGFEKVFVTQYSGDFGADILAEKGGVSYAIQCKCYKEAVGNRAVQEAHAGAAYYKKMVAAVMTNSHFTPAAIETAKELQVLLWDREQLLEMMK